MKTNFIKRNLRSIFPFFAFLIILAGFSLLTQGKILASDNLTLILEQSIVLVIASLGVTFVMSMGALDFSQGSLMAIASLAGVYLARTSLALALIVMVAICALLGFVNGVLVSKLKVSSFIVTICMMYIFRGLNIYLMTDTGAVPSPLYVSQTLNNYTFKFIVLIVIVAAAVLLFEYSRFGRYCKSIGAGELAAIYAGVPVPKIKILAFTIAGITCGIGAIVLLVRTGVAASGQRPGALAISSFGEAAVAVDSQRNALCPVMVSSDPRSDDIYNQFSSALDAAYIARVCGLPLSSTYSFTKLVYIRQHMPEIYAKTKYFLLISDFIYYKLSGIACSEYSVASRTMLFDIYNKKWDRSLMDKFGLDAEKFAEPVMAGTVIGSMDPRVAADMGILWDVKLVAGGHDQPCCAAGTGGDDKHVACSMGTSEALTPVFDQPLDPAVTIRSKFVSEPYLEAGKFNTMLFNPAAGLTVKWFFDTFCKHEYKDGLPPYALYEEGARKSTDSVLLLPFLCGRGTPEMNNTKRLSLHNIGPGTNLYDIYRAALEGMCFEQRLNIQMLAQTGIHIEGLIVTGGGSVSNLWLELKANILNLPIQVAETKEAVSLGCAMLCGRALGDFASLKEAAAAMCRVKRVIEPDKTTSNIYNAKYCEYTEILNGGIST